jgi:hypothetical protein
MRHLEAIATRNRNPVRFDLVVFLMTVTSAALMILSIAP